MLECEEFQNEMTLPMGLTNTFVLVHKQDSRKVSEFFLPKPHFTLLTQNTSSFYIHLNYRENNQFQCNCRNLITVYNDSERHYENDMNEAKPLKKDLRQDLNVPYQWFQSKDIFKGFKFLR